MNITSIVFALLTVLSSIVIKAQQKVIPLYNGAAPGSEKWTCADPVALFNQHLGRFPLWHVKDVDKESGKPVEVGNGYVEFKRIFAQANRSGMKHIFVEQDAAPKPFENIATSFKNLNKLLS